MKKQWILITVTALAAGCCHMHKEHEENEVKVSLNDVPAPVRATLDHESGGGTISSVDKEEKHGKMIYEADVISGGKNWEIKVDADGGLISKKIDEEENEKSK
jgi:uncharacterized membrane protein YkoI